MDEPFRGSNALRAGVLTEHRLRNYFRPVFRDVYVANDTVMTAALKARAAWLAVGPDVVLAGVSAAAVHRAEWLDPDLPAVVVRNDRRCPSGMVVHSYDLAPQEVCTVRGMRVTTPARTAFDLGRLLPAPKAVPILDALIRSTVLETSEVWDIAAAHPGLRGVRRLGGTVGLADGGAETALQSRVRTLLANANQPPLETQILVGDELGPVFTRAHMGWRQWQVVVQCDEDLDWTLERRSWQFEFTENLERIGWRNVWVTAPMMRDPRRVAWRVNDAVRVARLRLPLNRGAERGAKW
ncbi:hypothetical protein A5630_13450 [Mycolicibacterium mucogenicum]|uniref:DUF559 domain-containing protein n=1 Tax=Mycolicibacterium mucogenicum TaxID=56689 RepID=A0A1A3HCY8_MYCMU|nr:hypothetical protein [Mycolicibacterium mucogenicum]OBJ45471.1 hypothetical protein A5630_13450 [Mycolicibacterium mucogenicum]